MYHDYNYVLLRLKEEHVRCGLTQQQLCRYTKIPQSAFSRSETGCRCRAYPEIKRTCAFTVRGTTTDIPRKRWRTC